MNPRFLVLIFSFIVSCIFSWNILPTDHPAKTGAVVAASIIPFFTLFIVFGIIYLHSDAIVQLMRWRGWYRKIEVVYIKRKGQDPFYVIKVSTLLNYVYVDRDLDCTFGIPHYGFSDLGDATESANILKAKADNVRCDKNFKKTVYTAEGKSPNDNSKK